MESITDLLKTLPRPSIPQLPTPPYVEPVNRLGGRGNYRVGLAVEPMKRHMTDEGWQLFAGLEASGYVLQGHGIGGNHPEQGNKTYVPSIVDWFMGGGYGGTVVVQDKREWEGLTAGRDRNPLIRFSGIEALRARPDIFKVTVLKDAHANPAYHRSSAEEMDCHAWIVYYNPRIISHLAPYVRPEHLIRTYHSVDSEVIPPFDRYPRKGCILSGATGGAYPLRTLLVRSIHSLPNVDLLPHPGYQSKGSATPAYLETFSRYKVAICTASKFGYLLRKIIEATTCGCIVITNLPADEVVPEIEGNLVRIPSASSLQFVRTTVHRLLASYDPARQEALARLAKSFYDYRAVGARLSNDIESLRRRYP